MGFIVELTYPNHKQNTSTWSGISQLPQDASIIFNMKNGDQQRTNVKKTKPRTLDAFCSVATALAAKVFRLTLPVNNLKQRKRCVNLKKMQ